MEREKPDWRISNDKPYFVHDPNGDGFHYFSCIGARDEFAEECIREYCDDGWSEEVVDVVCGELTHRATMINKKDRPKDSELDEDGCDEDGINWSDYQFMCDYIMKPLNKEE